MPRTHSVYSVLKIDPLNENRCCGLTKAGLPCNNIVALASRQKAYNLLAQCSGLPFRSRQLNDSFMSAAGLLLCKRWHQTQSPTVYRGWIDLWELYSANADSDYASASGTRAEPNEDIFSVRGTGQHAQRPLHPSRSSALRRPLEQLETHTEDSPYERLLRSILRSNVSHDAKVSILLNAGVTGTGVDFRTANNASHTNNSSESSSDSAVTILPTTPATSAQAPSTLSRAQHSRNMAIAQQASSSLLSSTLSRSASSSSSSSSSSPSPPRAPRTETIPERVVEIRHSHVECCICTEPYAGSNTAFWECNQCHNRTHLECHRQWSLSDPRSTTCTFCRAIVPPIL